MAVLSRFGGSRNSIRGRRSPANWIGIRTEFRNRLGSIAPARVFSLRAGTWRELFAVSAFGARGGRRFGHPARMDSGAIIFSSDFLRTHSDVRQLTREVERGVLLKLRRGAYIPVPLWDAADDRARHLLRVSAVLADARSESVVAGLSAAAVWGMPVLAYPEHVSLLDRWKGGGRSEPGVVRTTAGFATARVVTVDGIRVTDLSRTALEVARRSSFAQAVGSVDWALSQRNGMPVRKDELARDIQKLPARVGPRHLERVVRFATDVSDSYGESMARATMFELGFASPQLQTEYRDNDGRMFADFSWNHLRIVAEFDGKVKYMGDLVPAGDPGEVVWREKLREDRLRALGLTVVRIVWSDLLDSAKLARKLAAVGVPRMRMRGSR